MATPREGPGAGAGAAAAGAAATTPAADDEEEEHNLHRSTSPRCLPCFASSPSSSSHPHRLLQHSTNHPPLLRLHLTSSSSSSSSSSFLSLSRSRSRKSDRSEIISVPLPLNDSPAQAQISNGYINGGLPRPTPEHLVIMVNGIIGSASNWKFAADQFVLKLEDKVVVHCSARNAATLTFDGVDVMGHRLAEEVKAVVDALPGLKKISFIAHSLGGLVARYAIGQLYTATESMTQSDEVPGSDLGSDADESEREKTDAAKSNGKLAGLQPVNFITVATPHLGSRGNRQLPFLCGVPLLEKVAIFSAHWFVGKTGKHLFMTDGVKTQPPLLLLMVTDCSEGQFISALKAFKCRVAYANISYDHMVGWRTASIRRECEVPQIHNAPVNVKYPHVVRVEDVPPDHVDVHQTEASDPVEEEMIKGLRQAPWRRVDVNFDGTPQRLAAHSTIQVKYYWMHSEGADVIAHIIDNFVV